MHPISVLRPDGSPRPGSEPNWDPARVHELHRAMLRSRVLDRWVSGLQRRGLVGLFAPATGYEAHIYGAMTALLPEDWIFADSRMTAAALYRGLDLRSWLAQMLGSASAPGKGHSLSQELSAKAVNFVTISSPLGTQIIQASGTAQGMKLKGDKSVCLTWFGPAAAATGDFHVGLNFAGLYRVPAVFYYCSSGDAEADGARHAAERFVDRAEGYGIRGVQVDGSDVFAVFAAVADAVARARAGQGPTLIEGLTGGPDGGQDPLDRLEAYMRGVGLDVDLARKETTRRLETLLPSTTEDLLGEGAPSLASLFDNVFEHPTARLREQREELLAHKARFASGAVA